LPPEWNLDRVNCLGCAIALIPAAPAAYGVIEGKNPSLAKLLLELFPSLFQGNFDGADAVHLTGSNSQGGASRVTCIRFDVLSDLPGSSSSI